MEALVNAPQTIDKIFLTKENEEPELLNAIKKAGLQMPSRALDKSAKELSGSSAHQGVIGRISLDKLMHSYDDFIGSLKINPDTSLVILGEIQDPHNVGAIIRSAAAFGVSGILVPEHNQAPITGAVIKVSAGMAFRIPIITIGNVNNAVRDLKKKGFWIYGLDGSSPKNISDESFGEPSVFVLGNESTGIREKTREICDILVSIPVNPKCESLNVAASAAVALHAWSIKHPEAIKN